MKILKIILAILQIAVLVSILIFLYGCKRQSQPVVVEIEASDLNNNDLVETYVFWRK